MKFQMKKIAAGATTSMIEHEIDDITGMSVLEFKQEIQSKVGWNAENIRLVCEGRVLENNFQLTHYKDNLGILKEGNVIHVLEYNNPSLNVDSAAQVVNTGGLSQHEEQVQALLNNPMVDAMMSNPEMVRMMMRMNPQLQQMMESNPEIARILDDPETLQQSMRAMRNPQLMREMMRAGDRSMANLNTIPGGEDALRRMHNEVQDPLYAALDGGNQNQSGSGTDRSADRYAQNEIPTGPLANPWATPATGSGGAVGSEGQLGGMPSLGGLGGMGGTAGSGANPFAAMFAHPPSSGNRPAGAAGDTTGASPGLGSQGSPPPGGLNPFQAMFAQGMQAGRNDAAAGRQISPGMQSLIQQSLSATSVGRSSGSSTHLNIPIGGLNPTPESVVAKDDEYKFECKYAKEGTVHKIYHCIKKTASIKELKNELESKVRFRAPYIRIVKGGGIWDSDKRISDYISAEKNNVPTSGSEPIQVFLVKNVPTGQTEIPLLATDSSGAALGGSRPLESPLQNPNINPLAGGSVGMLPMMNLFGPPGGASDQGGQLNQMMAMLSGLSGSGGAQGGAGGQDPLAALFAGMGGPGGTGGMSGFPAVNPIPPRQRFATQLQQLRNMGFEDEELCLSILDQVDGNIDRALDRLFGA